MKSTSAVLERISCLHSLVESSTHHLWKCKMRICERCCIPTKGVRYVTDRQTDITKGSNPQSISAGEMYSTLRSNGPVITVLVWCKLIHFSRRYAHCTKTFFCILIPIDLDPWPLDLKFTPLVTLVQRYVFTLLAVSMAFLFWEYRRHGTDRRGATLNAAS